MKYLVIGGNAAGMSFAAKMRRNDANADIVVIEKGDYVSFGACGLPYYVGEEIDDVEELIARNPQAFRDQNIDLRTEEEVLSVDVAKKEIQIKRQNGSTYQEDFDNLIVSSGANPTVFPGIDIDNEKIFTLTTKQDGVFLRNKLSTKKNLNIGIVGAGFIGLEVMDVLTGNGHNIDVLTLDENILATHFSEEIVENVQQEIVDDLKDVSLLLNKKIDNIEHRDGRIFAEVTGGEEREYDVIVLAIGFRPNTGFIEGVDKLPNGAIVADVYGESSVPYIYAVGDCATVWNPILEDITYVPLATGANKLGRMLADKLTSQEVVYNGMLGSACLKLLDYELARTGLTEKQCRDAGMNVKTNVVVDLNKPSYYPGHTEIKAKIVYDADSLQIYGIEMSGKEDVVGRINAMSLAIANKMTTKELGYADFCYAPPFARTWDFLNVVGNASK